MTDTPVFRLARSKAKLEASGGRRITLKISAQAAADLVFVRQWTNDSIDTDRAIVEYALDKLAASLRREVNLAEANAADSRGNVPMTDFTRCNERVR